MGVRGLSTFIKGHDQIILKNHRLHNCKLIVDAANFMNRLVILANRGLDNFFGGNLVECGKLTRTFIKAFKEANIELIFVFEGAAEEGHKSKTPIKLTRSQERFMEVRNMVYNVPRNEDYHVLPLTTTDLFKSILIDEGCQVIHSIYEADWEIARLAKEHNCPIMSEDSDFFLIDLPQGIVLTKEFKFQAEQDYQGKYIRCHLYMIERLVYLFPGLDRRSLPLLALLSGNDFVASHKFECLVNQIPTKNTNGTYGVYSRAQNRGPGRHHRLIKILHYLCGKSLEQNIQAIYQTFPSYRHSEIRSFLEENLGTYLIPSTDRFESELIDLYRKSYYSTHHDSNQSDAELESNYLLVMSDVTPWLRATMEKDVVSQRLLQVLFANQITLRPVVDDTGLPTCYNSHLKMLEVILGLVKGTTKDQGSRIVHTRVGSIFGPVTLYPRCELMDIDLSQITVFDLPFLTEQTRRIILLNTFASNEESFFAGLKKVSGMFSQATSEEYIALCLCLKFMRLDSDPKQPNLKTAVMMAFFYYLYKTDSNFVSKFGKQFENMIFLIDDGQLYNSRYPTVSNPMEIRVVHAINQLQSTIMSFNFLNALLGNIVTRIRVENWLNSSLIYNLVLAVSELQLRMDKIKKILAS